MWDARDRVESVYLDGLIKVYTENHYSLTIFNDCPHYQASV